MAFTQLKSNLALFSQRAMYSVRAAGRGWQWGAEWPWLAGGAAVGAAAGALAADDRLEGAGWGAAAGLLAAGIGRLGYHAWSAFPSRRKWSAMQRAAARKAS